MLQMIIPLVVFPMIGFIVVVFLKVKKTNRFIYYLLIPILGAGFVLGFLSHKKEKFLYSSVCIVRTAVIKDTYAGNQSNYVDVSFRRGEHRYKRNGVRFLGKGVASTLQIGDSLLVISVKDCEAIMYVYKARPTSEEFLKCQDFGYFYDGKLYSKEEFEKK
ncbi:MAG: hypothetical protein ACWA6U_18445 [Breznakibacter sp.]